MIILILKGGIGNQLFQLMAALFYSNKNDKNPIFIYTHNLQKYSARRTFSLEPFINNYDIKIEIIKKQYWFFHRYWLKIFEKLKLFTITDYNFQKKHFFIEFFDLFIIDGYFQQPYFLKTNSLQCLRSSLNEYYSINMILNRINQAIGDISLENLIKGFGIHIRGTDRKPGVYNHNISNSIQCFISDSDKIIFCFTDDANYASEILGDLNIRKVFSTDLGLSDLEEFYLMTMFNRVLITNSTYSVFSRLLTQSGNTTFVLKNQFMGPYESLLQLLLNNKEALIRDNIIKIVH